MIFLYRLPIRSSSRMQHYKYREGICHSFVRHHDEWTAQVSALQPLMGSNFDAVSKQLESVRRAKHPKARLRAQDVLEKAINRLEADRLESVRTGLIEAEQKIIGFIEKMILNKSTYLGHGVTSHGKLVEYFEVEDHMMVMVICPSREICSGNMRKIITVYFVTRNKYERKISGDLTSEENLGSPCSVIKQDDGVYLAYNMIE